MKESFLNRKFRVMFVCLLMLIYPFFSVYGQEPTVVTTLEEFVSAVANGGDIKLGADITMTGNIIVRQNVNLDLNGYTLNAAAKSLAILSDSSIKDSSGEQQGKITGTGYYKVQVGNKTPSGEYLTGNLTIDAGTIESDSVYVMQVLTGSSLTFNGGNINGAVINRSTMVMNGGTISSSSYGVYNYANASFEMNGGTVRSTGNVNAIHLFGNCSATINGGLIEALNGSGRKGGCGIGAFHDTQVTINGGEIKAYSFALSGNGTTNPNESNYGANAKFTITGGTLISTASGGAAIYAPQPNGETNISGGTMTGAGSAIEIRAGQLNITGGTFTGNQEEYDVDPNHNGNTTVGAAVSVKQHTTKQPIDVKISGGTFYGEVPFSESNPQDNPEEDLRKISYDISDGVFHSSGDTTVDVADMYNGEFIWGGKYTHWVTQYVKDGYGEKPEDNMIAVYKWRDVILNQSVNGATTVTRNKTISDDGTTIVTEPDQTSDTQVKSLYADEIYLNTAPAEDCALLKIEALDSHGNIIETIGGNTYLAPDDDSSVTAYYVKMISREIDPTVEVDKIDIGVRSKTAANAAMLKALKQNLELLNRVYKKGPILELVIEEKDISDDDKEAILANVDSGGLNILALYDIYVSVKDQGGNELGRIMELPEDIEFVIVLPKSEYSGDNEYYILSNRSSGYEIIDSGLSGDRRSISFKTNLMSKYVLVRKSASSPIPNSVLTGDNMSLIYFCTLSAILSLILLTKYGRFYDMS